MSDGEGRVLNRFRGRWRLDRVIEDSRAGQSGKLTGSAVFTPREGGLLMEEDGEMRLGDGPALRATRRYLWQAGKGARIEVLFGDGRFFHAFDADEDCPDARHDCDPDLYLVRYDFTNWPRWSALWQVSGPRKDYRMLSRYAPDQPGR